MQKNKIILIAAVLVLIVTVIFLYIWKGGGVGDYTSILSRLAGGGIGGEDKPPEGGLASQQPSADERVPQENILPGATLAHKYQNQGYGFSFEYPQGFNVSEFEEGSGYMILVQGPGDKKAFQVFITVYDEEGPLTAGRIKQDLPKLVMESPVNAQIGGAEAVVFFSKDESSSRTREAWFVWPESPIPHGNNIYQVTAPAEFDAELSKIMATFKFN